jgi:hypothetical protein
MFLGSQNFFGRPNIMNGLPQGQPSMMQPGMTQPQPGQAGMMMPRFGQYSLGSYGSPLNGRPPAYGPGPMNGIANYRPTPPQPQAPLQGLLGTKPIFRNGWFGRLAGGSDATDKSGGRGPGRSGAPSRGGYGRDSGNFGH